MNTLRSSMVVALLVGTACAPALAGNAESYGYEEQPNGNRLPTLGRTDYFNFGDNPDRLNTAEHELMHCIGFTTGYTNFRAHDVTQEGQRRFRANTDGTGTILAVLMADSNHVDPDAGVVNGRNQNLSIMQPNQVVNQRINAWEAAIMNAGFSWNTHNLDVRVTFVGTWPAAWQTAINDAVTNMEALFGSNSNGHRFDWHVRLPAPGTLAPLAGMVLIATRRRR